MLRQRAAGEEVPRSGRNLGTQLVRLLLGDILERPAQHLARVALRVGTELGRRDPHQDAGRRDLQVRALHPALELDARPVARASQHPQRRRRRECARRRGLGREIRHRAARGLDTGRSHRGGGNGARVGCVNPGASGSPGAWPRGWATRAGIRGRNVRQALDRGLLHPAGPQHVDPVPGRPLGHLVEQEPLRQLADQRTRRRRAQVLLGRAAHGEVVPGARRRPDRGRKDPALERHALPGVLGLPDGQIGNSEVGHLNLGAGRVVPQDIVRISQAIQSGEFFRLPPLVELCERTRQRGGTLHLIGLIGTGGVHALDQHLLAAVELGRRHELPVAIHAWLDGRDTAPTSALGFMEELLEGLGTRDSGLGGGGARVPSPESRVPIISTVVGRYYAMDRDKRWERTKLAYDAMVHGVGAPAPEPLTAIRAAYQAGETDEFVKPRVITGTPRIRSGDGVFCFNFRADRMRQMVRALAVDGFDSFDTGERPKVDLVTMTQYDETFRFPMAFGPMVLSQIVAQVLSERGEPLFRNAETEMYAHITYFCD